MISTCNLKRNTNGPICETETESGAWRIDFWLPEARGTDGVGSWDTERINKVLLSSAGNYIQFLVINHNEKEYLKRRHV